MSIDFTNAANCLSRARIKLLQKQPFFAALVMGYQLVEDPDTPTLATDDERIYYNPDFVVDLHKENPNLITSALAHEAGHTYLMHTLRRGSRDPDLFNQAGDYVINLILDECHLPVHQAWLFDHKYKGWTTDEVYADLKQNGNSGNSKGNGKEGDKLNPGGCCRPKKGTGPGGTLTASERQQGEREIKSKVVRAANQARMRGKLPAFLEQEIEALLNPPEPWQDHLREFMTNISRDNYNWQRPCRQFITQGIILPSLYSHRLGPIVVALDCSGSVSMPEFEAFMDNLSSIIEDCRPEVVYVVHCDAAVARVDEFTFEDMPIPARRYASGGTSFKPPFKWVEDNGIEPECLIYFTDTEGDFPAEPDYPVMWATVGRSASVPWGEQIRVQAD